jgi:hypothetical protein
MLLSPLLLLLLLSPLLLLLLLMLMALLQTSKTAAAAVPRVCSVVRRKRGHFASLRSNASLHKLLHPFPHVPDEDVLGYNLQWPEKMVAGNSCFSIYHHWQGCKGTCNMIYQSISKVSQSISVPFGLVNSKKNRPKKNMIYVTTTPHEQNIDVVNKPLPDPQQGPLHRNAEEHRRRTTRHLRFLTTNP